MDFFFYLKSTKQPETIHLLYYSQSGCLKVRDRATAGLRPSLICEAEILEIHDEFLD